MNNLKNRIKLKETSIGSWITINNPCIAEIMAGCGFEWLTVDLEHSSLTIENAADIIRVIELCGISPFVRVSDNNETQIKRIMDAGAHGIIVPMVNSREEAEKAVRSVHYPPIGNRGVGLSRAQKYGTAFSDYLDWLTNDSIIILQIEHIKAVENLASIITVQGIDAIIIGPYDLSGSLGVPGDFDNQLVEDALKEIKIVCNQYNMPFGTHVVHPDPIVIKDIIQEGYSLIAYSVDFLLLGEACRKDLDVIYKNNSLYRENK